MQITPTRKLRHLLALSALCLAPLTSPAQVLYEQFFTNTTAGNTALSTVGWTGAAGSGSTFTTIDGNRTFLSNAQGDGRTDPDTGLVYPTGFLNVGRTGNSGINPNNVLYTTFAALDFTSSTISWITNTSANAGVITERFMVQSGGVWYASAISFAPQNNRSAAQLTTDSVNNLSLVQSILNFDPTAANWLVVNMGPSSLTLGAAASSDISASITGIGFFVTNASGTLDSTRIDTLSIVPEPTSLALIGLGLGLGFGLVRSRSRRLRPAA